ncbi:MAG: hypothetical protein R3B55_02120 [Candidatus Paceibacterota bacterium]
MWPFVLTAYVSADETIRKINKAILNPLIALLFAIAAIYFAYGLVLSQAAPDKPDAREKGTTYWQ